MATITQMQMAEKGYRNVSVDELNLFTLIGDKEFYRVIDYGFRVAYWSCKHMEYIPGDKGFSRLFKQARKMAVENAMQLVVDGHPDYIDLMIHTDAEIVEKVGKDLEGKLIELKAPTKTLNS